MLTGKTRYRLSWRKKMILQVEHWCRSSSYPNPYHRTYSAHWFDATFQDVMDLQDGKVEPTKPADECNYPPHHRKNRDAPARTLSRELNEQDGIDYKFLGMGDREDVR